MRCENKGRNERKVVFLTNLFPIMHVQQVQVIVTAHAADGRHDPTVAGLNAVSAALHQSRQPWAGPIGCCRIGSDACAFAFACAYAHV